MGTPRILIVEDEAIVAMDIEGRLALLGYEVAGTAAAGEEALALVEERRPDLVLMDIRLEGKMDGVAAAGRIRDRFRLPVVFLTAYSEDSTLDRAKGADPFGYILKPFEDRELRTVIEMALYKHRAEEEILRLNRLYAVLSQVNQAIMRARSRAEIFDQVCRIVVEQGGFKMAWVGWLDPATARVKPVAQFGDEQDYLSRLTVYADDRGEGRGLTGTALREGKPAFVNDFQHDERMTPWHEAGAASGFGASAAFPFRLQGEVCGALTLYAAEEGLFHERQIRLLEEVALDVSFGLDKLEEEEQRKRAEEAFQKSERFVLSTIDSLAAHICVLDEAGTILLTNRAWRDFAKANPPTAEKAMEGANYLEVCDGVTGPDAESAAEFTSGIRAVIQGGRDTFSMEYSCHSPSEKRWFVGRVTRFSGPGPVRIVVGHENITERKLAEEALKESENRYRRLFDEATEGVVLADADTGIIRDCNQAFLRLAGYEKAELIGRPQTLLHPPEGGGQSVSRTFALHRSKKQGQLLDARLITRAGAVRDVEIKANVLDFDGRRVLQGFFRDVTEERRVQFEREISLALMRLLNQQNNTHELIRLLTRFFQDWTGCEAVGVRLREGDDFPYLETRGFSAEFVEAENRLCVQGSDGQVERDEAGNPVLECMCGNILSGRFDPALPFFTEKGSFWSNGTTELLARTTEADRQTRTRNRCNREGYESVALIPLRRGEKVFGLLQFNDRAKGRFTPELIGFLENAGDQIAVALAQRQAQVALQASEARFRAIFDSAGVAIGLADLQARWVQVNKAFERMTGYRDEELCRLSEKLTHPDDLADHERRLADLRAARVDSIRAEKRYVRKDGTVFWVDQSVNPIRNDDGLIVGLVTVGTDVTERKQAEEALRSSELKYRRLHESMTDAFVATDMEGHIQEFNPAYRAMLGYADEELRLLTYWDLTPETWHAFEDRIVAEQVLPKGYSGVYEKEYRRRDGTVFPVELRTTLIRDEAGRPTGMWAIVRDITDRKLAEDVLHRSEKEALQLALENAVLAEIGRIVSSTPNIGEVYRTFSQEVKKLVPFDRLGIGVIHEEEGTVSFSYIEGISVSGRGPEGAVPLPGTAVEKVLRDHQGLLLDLEDEQGITKVCPGLLPEFRAGIRSTLTVPLILRNRVLGVFSLRSMNPGIYTDRDLRLAESVGNQIAGTVANSQLWIERKRMEDALLQSERRLMRAQAIGRLGNWEIDLPTRRIWASEEAFRIYGIERTSEFLPLDFVQQRVLPEDRPCMDAALRDLLTGARDYDAQFRIRRDGDGEVRFLHSKAERIVDETGTPVKVAGVIQDITERRHLEDQLRQAQKMEAVGQLAGGVAHDFNNILAATMMRLGLLQSDPDLTADTRAALKELEGDVRRAASLTRQLLIFSRRQVMQIKRLDLNEVLSNLLKMLRRLLGEHIDLLFQGGSTSLSVEADAGMMEQVVMNLCVNARDAMPGGGRLTLGTRRIDIDAESAKANPEARPGPFVCLTVTDTGTGMDEATMRHVFEPFFTTKEVGKGTGLGLATVYGIAKQHQGWVEVESTVGKGSTFRVFLPASAGPAEGEASSETINNIRGGTETILLVEDEATLRRMAALSLKKRGYTVLEAANGVEALKLWEEQPERVNLLLTDMVMPEGVTGLDLADRLRKDRAALKVIVSSGYSVDMAKQDVLTERRILFLPKPYEGATLLKVVRDCLDGREGEPDSTR
jgi:PAS domain S-box-containing protein